MVRGKLEGRVAIITGSARGQGAATARIFAQEGAQVIITDILDEGAVVAKEIGDKAYWAKLDITNEADWQRVVAEVDKRFGGADILINNAGICPIGTLLDQSLEGFEQVLRVNLIGAWLGIKTVAPGMVAKKKGAIVNICSTSALWGMNGLGAYSASKWALRGLTKCAALELGFQGVRVNAIMPGGVKTPMAGVVSDSAEVSEEHYQRQPIRRMGKPEEIARTSLFLVSDDASYLCGAEIAVDGGMTVGNYTDYTPGGLNSAT